ncbi:TPA: hypothetical protein AB5H75_003985 [Vibrio mimicus]
MIYSDPITSVTETYALRLVKMFWSRINKKYAIKQLESDKLCDFTIEGARLSNNDNCILLDVRVSNKSPFRLSFRDLCIDTVIDNMDYLGFPRYTTNEVEPYSSIAFRYPLCTGKIARQSNQKIQISKFDFLLMLGSEAVKKEYCTRGHTAHNIELR